MKRPSSIAIPSDVLYQGVFPLNPPKAEPLLATAEVKAYSTWLNPCGPAFDMAEVPKLYKTEIAVNTRMASGNIRITSIAIFTS